MNVYPNILQFENNHEIRLKIKISSKTHTYLCVKCIKYVRIMFFNIRQVVKLTFTTYMLFSGIPMAKRKSLIVQFIV